MVAGMVRMNPAKFTIYNALGSFLWAGSIVSAGFLLGENAWAQENLEIIIIGIIVITTGPVILKLLMGKRKKGLQTAPVYSATQK
jgi:membrane-associated protein